MTILKNQGFTLIEVLIASFIMFISLAAFTLVFRSAIISSDKAENNVSSAAYVDVMLGDISAQLFQNKQLTKLQGNGALFGRNYSWKASVINVTQPPARYFGQTLSQAEHQAKIWRIALSISYNQKISEYQYQEVTW